MFKDNSNSQMSKNNFGVGSIINAGDDKYLVVGTADSSGKLVSLINLQNFMFLGLADDIRVADHNHFTATEARNLVDKTLGRKLNWTFTDFDFDPAGIKSV